MATPSVETASITEIGQTTATGGGTILSTGGKALTAYGVCWNTTGNPTIADAHTDELSRVLALTGIASGSALGAVVVAEGAVTRSLTGIATGQAFGSASAVRGVARSLTGIATGQAFGSVTVAKGAVTRSLTGVATGAAFGTPTAEGEAEWSPFDGDTQPDLFDLVVSPTTTSGTEGSPTTYSYKRFVRSSSSTSIISFTNSSRSWIVFDHCIFDPGYVGYLNTWNCVTINHTATVKYNHIWFVDCLFKGNFDGSTNYSLNRMGFECTGRPADNTATDVYQDIRLVRCVFEPTGSEAISFDGPEMSANCVIEDVLIKGSGNHPTAYSWGQGFEINGPKDFDVTNLTIHPGRGSGTNLGGTDRYGGNCNWTFTNLVLSPDYDSLQVVQRGSDAHPVYAHDMHGSTWTGTVEQSESGGSSYHAYLNNCDNNDFTGVDWVDSPTFYQLNCTGNTGLS